MAKLFLESGDIFPVAVAAQVFGAAGSGIEIVTLPNNPSGVSIDANVERVEFASNAADYLYKITGNEVSISINGAVVATINAGNSPKLAFADGSANLSITGLGAANLGGVSLSSSNAALSAAPSLDANDKSSVATAENTSTSATFSLTSNNDQVSLLGVSDFVIFDSLI